MKYRCIKDLVMEDTAEVAAVKGAVYEVEKPARLWYFTDEQGFEGHRMRNEDMLEFFEPVTEEEVEAAASPFVACPTCGSKCRIYSSDEGTSSFDPVTPYRE